jgi:hypothetical protein
MPNVLDALRAAIDRSGIPHKALAIELDVSEAHVSRMLGGGQAFPIADLDRLPRGIRESFLSLYAASCGMRVERQDEQARAISAALESLGRAIEAIGLRTAGGSHGTND